MAAILHSAAPHCPLDFRTLCPEGSISSWLLHTPALPRKETFFDFELTSLYC